MGSRILTWLWGAYLVALPFQRMWTLPGLGTKLQPPELLFLALVPVAVAGWRRDGLPGRVVPLDYAVATWGAANLLSLGMTWPTSMPISSGPAIEVLGALYLAALYVAVRVTATRPRLTRFAPAFTLSAALAAGCGLAGFLLSWFSVSTRLATIAVTPVPYLGTAPRAFGFTAHPQMLASLLVMGILLHIGHRLDAGWRRRDLGVLLLLIAGLLVTVSKTMLCLTAGLVVMPAFAARRSSSRRSRWTAAVGWAAVLVAFTVGSHVVLLREARAAGLRASQIVAGEPMYHFRWSDESWLVMPTTYVYNKQASWLAITRRWPWGVGPAGHADFVTRLQDAGEYPPSILATDPSSAYPGVFTEPHSTYLGAAAELGMPGVLALGLLLVTAGGTAVRLSRRDSMPRWTTASYVAVGAAFLIEAIATDLMSCRHYWLLLGVIASWDGSLRPGHSGFTPTDANR